MGKLCKTCNEEKSLDLFVKSKDTKSGYRGICKTCFNEYYARRRIEKYEQVRQYEKKFHKQRRLKYEYGINEDILNQMLEDQNHKCKICKNESKLVIDHCHNSGEVRGLLCSKCNLGLGHFQDNKDYLMQAIEYLDKTEKKYG